MTALVIDYDPVQKQVVFRASKESSASVWLQQILRALQDHTSMVSTPQAGIITAPWWSFLAVRQGIGAILLNAGVSYDISEQAGNLLKKSNENSRKHTNVLALEELSPAEIQHKLVAAGWNWDARPLTSEQMRNIQKLAKLTSGATFSVPGAGKTTEALAYFYLRSIEPQHLLVVAPKNAFSAWEEQLIICIKEPKDNFVRLRGGVENISDLLKDKPKFMLITYHQLARVSDLISYFIAENDTFMFLDESHKIKAGQGRATVDAVLAMSHLPVGKLLMSGTPMPQSIEDLVPQFKFLYPEKQVTGENVNELIRPIFVRTTKKELKIPDVKRLIIPVPFNQSQRILYDLMRSEVAREAEGFLNKKSRAALRALGRSVIRLIAVVSNPCLLVKDIGFLHQELLSEVLSEGAAPKIRFACERARMLALKNKKTIIWTTFRKNVESIADKLRDLNSVYIHGGIDAGDEEEDDTREGRIKIFHNDPNCFVMVANPAAAAEGISLHKVCHHAIYVDRTFNAAHYIQSEDRIHRLGILPDEAPNIEILQCPDCIDESIQIRLETKVARMGAVLDDQNLQIGADQYVPFDVDDDPESQLADMDEDDIKNILETLRRDN